MILPPQHNGANDGSGIVGPDMQPNLAGKAYQRLYHQVLSTLYVGTESVTFRSGDRLRLWKHRQQATLVQFGHNSTFVDSRWLFFITFFFIQSNQGEYDMTLVDSEGNQLYFGSYSLSQVIRLKKRYHLFEALFSSTLHPSLYLVQDSQLVCEQSGGKFSCA